MKYELSENVLHNLEIFLKRVELKGEEVPAYVDVINALNKPLDEKNVMPIKK